MPEQTELTAADAVPELGLAQSRSLAAVAVPLLVGLLLASVVAAWDGGYFAGQLGLDRARHLLLATIRLILVPRRRGSAASTASCSCLLAAFAGWLAAVGALVAGADADAERGACAPSPTSAPCCSRSSLVRRATVTVLLGSVLAGVTAVGGYALLTRLLPDRIGSWTRSAATGSPTRSATGTASASTRPWARSSPSGSSPARAAASCGRSRAPPRRSS